MKIVNGWAFPDADSFMASHIGKDGKYQYSHLEGAMKHVKNFGGAVDGGAHVGTWSRILSEKFASVLAFEPSADTKECLEKNMRTFKCENVNIVHAALGDKPGRVRMTLEGFDRAIELKNTGARFTRPGDDVDVVMLDSLKLDALDFIKLDIEGSEPAALRGAIETLKRCKPVVLFEDKGLCFRHFGEPKTACADLLKSIGMTFIEKIGCDQIWGW